jgi:hypothetical protein
MNFFEWILAFQKEKRGKLSISGALIIEVLLIFLIAFSVVFVLIIL